MIYLHQYTTYHKGFYFCRLLSLQSRPRSGLTVYWSLSGSKLWHTDSVPEFFFFKKLVLKKVSRGQRKHKNYPACKRVKHVTLKAPQLQQTTNFGTSYLIFEKNKVWYFMRIVCRQTILMKYHGLFVFFEKAAKFQIPVCSKLQVALYGLKELNT